MIKKDAFSGDYELTCDVCGKTKVFAEFDSAVAFKRDKKNGWYARKLDDDVWNDFCDTCCNEMNGNILRRNKK